MLPFFAYLRERDWRFQTMICIPPVPYPPFGHLPLEGKAKAVRCFAPSIKYWQSRHHKFESRDVWLGIRSLNRLVIPLWGIAPYILRGEAATTIPNSSFKQSFRTHSKDSTPKGLTLNPHRFYDFFNSRRSAIHTIFILLIYVSLYIPECAII